MTNHPPSPVNTGRSKAGTNFRNLKCLTKTISDVTTP